MADFGDKALISERPEALEFHAQARKYHDSTVVWQAARINLIGAPLQRQFLHQGDLLAQGEHVIFPVFR